MKILIISDIHSNYTALKAVLSDAGEVDATWCLGDLVGYGPDPNECIQTVKSLPNLVCLLGNHDAAVIGHLDVSTFNREAGYVVNWTYQVLTSDNREFLNSLPESQVVEDVSLFHGSPRNPIWEYLLDLRTVEQNFAVLQTPIGMVGHTHIPAVYTLNGQRKGQWHVPLEKDRFILVDKTIANPGSVGQPRDHDPRASYVLYDSERRHWELRRVSYNVVEVETRIIRAKLPTRHATRLFEGW
jgi:diadenosine tetraphosphatase ApaH/serine/threonine PP2A family protein phosphatase